MPPEIHKMLTRPHIIMPILMRKVLTIKKKGTRSLSRIILVVWAYYIASIAVFTSRIHEIFLKSLLSSNTIPFIIVFTFDAWLEIWRKFWIVTRYKQIFLSLDPLSNYVWQAFTMVPALRVFWDLEKTVLHEICVSGTVLWSPTNANSPTYTYISQKPW